MTGTVSTEVKTVGKSGQISIGKSYAGKTLRLEKLADGTIVLTAVVMVPESQIWTTVEPHRSRIARGMEWAAKTPRAESDLDGLAEAASRRTGRVRGRSK